LPHTLDPNEAFLTYFFDDSFLAQLLVYSHHNVSREAVSKLLIQVSFENKELSVKVLQCLMRETVKCSIDELSSYILLLHDFMLAEDSNLEVRTSLFVKYLEEIVVKAVGRSYIPCSLLVDLLLALALRSRPLGTLLKEKPDSFGYLQKWLKSHPYPKPDTVQM
jgi:hypothetical protein